MRLINCQTLEFEEYYRPESIDYAILSHRWEDEEVTYQEMLGDRGHLANRKAYQKIKKFCQLADLHRMTHAWVDTCCIDKTSSAELSEAINSMYAWYGFAKECFVYLHDLTTGGDLPLIRPKGYKGNPVWYKNFTKCSWFYRGWTLQELIAPKTVLFYDRDWIYINSKSTLAPLLSTATKIPEEVLTQETDLYSLSIAERMTWAAKRECSRLEDTAYSLLGIFDINMPLLYGEGIKAFRRLQQELIRQTNDQTIFLWEVDSDAKSSLLALSPSSFSSDWRFRASQDSRSSYTITNSGLNIRLPVVAVCPAIYLAALDCELRGEDDYRWLRPEMYLRLDKATRIYRRVIFGEKAMEIRKRLRPSEVKRIQIDVDLGSPLRMPSLPYRGQYGFRINELHLHKLSPPNPEDTLTSSYMEHGLERDQGRFMLSRSTWVETWETAIAAEIYFPSQGRQLIAGLKLGFDFDFVPACVIQTSACDDVFPAFRECHNHNNIQDDVSSKLFRKVDFTEKHGWIDAYRFNAGRARSCTICLKPPAVDDQVFAAFPLESAGFHRCTSVELCTAAGAIWRIKVEFRRTHDSEDEPLVWDFSLHAFMLCERTEGDAVTTQHVRSLSQNVYRKVEVDAFKTSPWTAQARNSKLVELV